MTGILEIREYIKDIYGKYDIYILPVLKLILAIIIFAVIGANAGYMSRLSNPALILVLALLCSFLPVNVLVVLAALYTVANVYALSLECAIVMGAVFLIMFLIYFRFAPSDALVLILTPLGFLMHIPYAIPLCCGLAGSPASAISCACGVVVYYIFDFIKVNEADIVALDAQTTVTRLRFVVDGLLSNKEMLVMAAAFALTVIVVYIIRRLPVDHAWTIAIMTGFFTSMIAVLAGSMAVKVTVSIGGVILGGLASMAIAMVLKFFVFSVDYTRTERLQFEDDEYYYYVKAVPKVTLAAPEKTVKKISQPSRDVKDYPIFNQARLDDSGYPSASSRRRPLRERNQNEQSEVSGVRPVQSSRPSQSPRPVQSARPSSSSRPAQGSKAPYIPSSRSRSESSLPRDRRIVQQKPADGSINYGRPAASQGNGGQPPSRPASGGGTAYGRSPQTQGRPGSAEGRINYGRPSGRVTDNTRVIRKRPDSDN